MRKKSLHYMDHSLTLQLGDKQYRHSTIFDAVEIVDQHLSINRRNTVTEIDRERVFLVVVELFIYSRARSEGAAAF